MASAEKFRSFVHATQLVHELERRRPLSTAFQRSRQNKLVFPRSHLATEQLDNKPETRSPPNARYDPLTSRTLKDTSTLSQSPTASTSWAFSHVCRARSKQLWRQSDGISNPNARPMLAQAAGTQLPAIQLVVQSQFVCENSYTKNNCPNPSRKRPNIPGTCIVAPLPITPRLCL